MAELMYPPLSGNTTIIVFSGRGLGRNFSEAQRDQLEGIENYGSALVELELEFQPDTKEERQKLLEDEKPYITYFEYADFLGYAIINVSDTGINTDIYTGDSDKVWKNVLLGSVLNN
ncbi:MAG: hypothetical protein KAV87_18290 [Desulfobacteraceae bacterium]|nr:hypothetical protein [Desulfobacteraceae bacterium]